MSFLPTDYREPVISKYTKFQEGENKIRILSEAITGWVYWITVNGKRVPKRVTLDQTIPTTELEENPKTGEVDMPKVFWAFSVFNYQDNAVQVLELTQKTIRDAIKALNSNPKWGDPKQYDLSITQVKIKDKTSYNTQADPKEDLDPEIVKRAKATPINLNALYWNEAKKTGGDPFAPADEKVNPDEVVSGLEKLRVATPGK